MIRASDRSAKTAGARLLFSMMERHRFDVSEGFLNAGDGGVMSDHGRGSIEYGYVVAGAVELTVGEQTYDLGAGDAVQFSRQLRSTSTGRLTRRAPFSRSSPTPMTDAFLDAEPSRCTCSAPREPVPRRCAAHTDHRASPGGLRGGGPRADRRRRRLRGRDGAARREPGDRFAQWAPDGERIAFLTDRDGETSLAVTEMAVTSCRRP